MAIDQWAKDDKGIILKPFSGYEVAVFRRSAIGMRLLVTDNRSPAGSPQAVQITCTPDQARAFAKSLTDAADKAAETPEAPPRSQ